MLNEAARRAESQLFRPADYEMQSRINRIYTNKERIQRVKVHSSVFAPHLFESDRGMHGATTRIPSCVRSQYLICFHGKFQERACCVSKGGFLPIQKRQCKIQLHRRMHRTTPRIMHSQQATSEHTWTSPRQRSSPDYRHFREPASESRPASGKIRFEDLWYLMQPGDLVYLPEKTVKKFLAKAVNPHVKCCSTLSHKSAMQQNVLETLQCLHPLRAVHSDSRHERGQRELHGLPLSPRL